MSTLSPVFDYSFFSLAYHALTLREGLLPFTLDPPAVNLFKLPFFSLALEYEHPTDSWNQYESWKILKIFLSVKDGKQKVLNYFHFRKQLLNWVCENWTFVSIYFPLNFLLTVDEETIDTEKRYKEWTICECLSQPMRIYGLVCNTQL